MSSELCNLDCSIANNCIAPEARVDARISPSELCANIPFSKNMLPKGQDTPPLKMAWSNIEQALSAKNEALLGEAQEILNNSLEPGVKTSATFICRAAITSAYLPAFQAQITGEQLSSDRLQSVSDSLARTMLLAANEVAIVRMDDLGHDRKAKQRHNELKGMLGKMTVFFANVNGVMENSERSLLYPSSIREREGLDGRGNFRHDCYSQEQNGHRRLFKISTVNHAFRSRPAAENEVGLILPQQEAAATYNKIYQTNCESLSINTILNNLPLATTDPEQQYFVGAFAANLDEVIKQAPLVPSSPQYLIQ